MKKILSPTDQRLCKHTAPALLLVFSTAVLAACSEADTGTVPMGYHDPEPDVAGTPLETTLPDKFPVYTENDDPVGLIVTGLNGVDSSSLVSPWLVNVGTFRKASKTPGTGDVYVDLLQYKDDFPISAHIDFFQPQLETCLIRDVADDSSTEQDAEHLPPLLISGGESIVLNTSSGPWLRIARELSENGESRYEANDLLPSALPVDAMLSVPGDVFPTVAAHALHEPAAPERLLPDGSKPITADSEYSWLPGQAQGYGKINLLAYNKSGEFEGFLVTCWVEDDGTFLMPSDIRDLVAATTYRLEARYSRVYSRLDLVNGIVVYQENEIAE